MKKFQFIIPKVICSLFVFNLLLYSSLEVKAQIYGCHVQRGMSEVIYITPYGSDWQTVPSGTITSTGEIGGYKNDGTATYGCIADLGGICTVYQQYEISHGPPQTIGMRPYKIGVYASIDLLNCPLDDNVLSLFIFTACLAFFRLKKQVQINEYEGNDHNSRI